MGNNKSAKVLCYAVVTAMVCTTVANPMDAMAGSKAKLAKKTLTITQGKSQKIVIKNKKSKAKYKFKASNAKIKVTNKGKVTAVKVGTAKVTVKETYKKKTRKVGVVTVKVKAKKINVPTEAPATTSEPTTVPTVAPTAAPSAAPTATPTASASQAPTATPTASASQAPTATPTVAPTIAPTEAPEEEKTVVYNNYFEDGEFKDITGRGATIEISQSENHTEGGMNSLLCTGRSDTWHGASLSLSKLTEIGSSYDFSAWVKQNSGSDQTIAMKLEYTDKEGNKQYKSVIPDVEGGVTCESGKWVNLKGSYVIPETDEGVTLYFEMSSDASADFLIDDVIIEGKEADITEFKMTDEVYNKIKTDSLLSTGNNARLKNVIAKARNGEDVTLAYIGGSITEGALASPNSKCYAEVSANAFAAAYGKDGGANVHFINAGMSGTPSDIGIVRYNRDVIERLPEGSDHPDILFIEFAVNDFGAATKGGAYEGLIRQALKSGSAVVLIFSVFQKGSGGRVMENEYRPFGEYYNLPMISMGDGIMQYFDEDGFYEWYFGDKLHPNKRGYKLMSDCIMNLMDTVDKAKADTDNITDIDAMAPKKTSTYQGIKMIDATTKVEDDADLISIDAGSFTSKDSETGNFQYEYNGETKASWFPDNWMHATNADNNALTIKLNCKTLMFVYKLSSSNTFGSADLYIDGEKKGTLSGYDSSGWNNGKVFVAMTDDTAAEHTIELKMKDTSLKKNFTLMAIGYN
ncbi:MAG: carbohydrate binding domain-containing protein [Eubacterium sp.]